VGRSERYIELSRSEKLERIVALGIDPWGSRFDGHQAIESVRALQPDADPPVRVRIAGRIVQRRGMGKVFFLDLKDWTGRIQVYVGQKQIGEQGWLLAQELDLGDLLGIDGTLGKDAHRRADRFRRGRALFGQVAVAAPRQVERHAGNGISPAPSLSRSHLQCGNPRTRPANAS